MGKMVMLEEGTQLAINGLSASQPSGTRAHPPTKILFV